MRKAYFALAAALVLYMLSKTDKGQQVTASVADAVASTVRGIRNNNPGNLRANSFKGFVGVDAGGYAVYDTMQNGVRASARQLKLYIQRGINTPRKIITTWAPASENNTAAYIDAATKYTGFSADQVLTAGEAVLFLLCRAIFRHELGALPAATISDAMIRQGIADA